MDSDHRLVIARCRFKVPNLKKYPRQERIKYESLKDPTLKENIQARTDEAAAIVNRPSSTNEPNTKWNNFCTTVKEIAKDTLGTKIVGGKPKKRTPYWTAELKEAVTEKMLAFRMCMNTNNAEAY